MQLVLSFYLATWGESPPRISNFSIMKLLNLRCKIFQLCGLFDLKILNTTSYAMTIAKTLEQAPTLHIQQHAISELPVRFFHPILAASYSCIIIEQLQLLSMSSTRFLDGDCENGLAQCHYPVTRVTHRVWL